MHDEQRKETIGALLREKQGYEDRGDEASVAGVNDQLRELGHQGMAPSRRAETRPAGKSATTRKKG